MFKLVVLFSVLALATANPVWPNAWDRSAVGSTQSGHGVHVPVAHGAVRGQPTDNQDKPHSGAHHVGKRSVVPFTYSQVVGPVAAVSPVTSYQGVVGYPSPFVSAYSTPFAHTYAYPSVYPKALSVHPW